MSIFQILSVLFGLLMMFVVSIHRKKSHLSMVEVSFWFSVWFVFIFIALFPQTLLGITQLLNFARVFDLLTVIAFMVLSIMVIFSYLRQKELAQKLETFVRKDALNTIKRNSSSHEKEK